MKILKIISVTLFRQLVAAFRKPTVTLEMVAEAGCGPENSCESHL
jgi:hypothetical protein